MFINRGSSALEKKLENKDKIENSAVIAFSGGNYQTALNEFSTCQKILESLKINSKKQINYNQIYANILIQMGRCHYHLGNFEKAIIYLEKGFDSNNKRMDAYYYLALCHKANGADNKAQDYAERVLKFNRADFEKEGLMGGMNATQIQSSACILLGDMAKDIGDLEKAKTFYQRGDAAIRLAEIAFIQKDYINAIEYSKLAAKAAADINEQTKYIAYYYWSMSIIHNVLDKANLSEDDKKNIDIAFRLLDKIEQVETPEMLFNFAYCYDEEHLGKRDPKKALEYYERAAQQDQTSALFNLAQKYEKGEDVAADPKKAFDYYQKAAQLNYAPAQSELARCYICGIGCAVNRIEARKWAEKAAQANLALGKTHYASLLLLQANEENNPQLGLQAIGLFKEAVEIDDIASACFNLGLVYHFGLFTAADFTLAEYYYREAIRLGYKKACNLLFSMYAMRLKESHLSDSNHKTLEKACSELKEEFEDVEAFAKEEFETMLASLKNEQEKRNYFNVLINKSINHIAAKSNRASKNKITAILEKIQPGDADTINLSTSILRISSLLEIMPNGIDAFKVHEKSIVNLLQECLKRLPQKKFSTRSLCNIITGVSRLYQHGYKPLFDQLLTTAFDTLIKENTEPSILDISTLLSASIRTTLRTNILTKYIQTIIDVFLKHLNNHLPEQRFLPIILYNLAVLANYKDIYPEFALQLNPQTLEPLFVRAIENLRDNQNQLTKEEQHQYYLALCYFHNRNPNLMPANTKELLSKWEKELGYLPKQIKISKLQTEIYAKVEPYLPGCEQETVINTLPVDFCWKNYVFQVDGPKHFIFFSEKGGHTLSARDIFRDTLLNCAAQVPWKIIHLDYLEYAAKGMGYLATTLSRFGIHLPTQSSKQALPKPPTTNSNNDGFFIPFPKQEQKPH